MMFRLAAVLAALTLLAMPAAAAPSKAAAWLASEQVAKGCASGKGHFEPAGLREVDLDGDGRDDLLLAHENLVCAGGGRSMFCGAQVCSVILYLRRGELLQEVETFLGGGIEIGPGRPPIIHTYGHGGTRHKTRWNGQRFAAAP